MAIAKDIIGKSLQGTLGKQLVFKQYGDKTVVTAYPDMSHIVPSDLQKESRNKFKEAVAFAKQVVRDVNLKAVYGAKAKPKQTVYHCALQAYLKGEI
ncbi:hypothetical protein ACFOW1_01275 [Parasediminibacterium paludis]|uniref:Uncharacterized protein n=1 Tax=Parasediminibacterium paludis TaxID=908966 RepID=A0ABV8PQS3_9BACT